MAQQRLEVINRHRTTDTLLIKTMVSIFDHGKNLPQKPPDALNHYSSEQNRMLILRH